MKQTRALKRKLGEDYHFKRCLSDREIARLKKQSPESFMEHVAAVLVAGCVKIEAVLFQESYRSALGYDVFVRDEPGSPEWILYEILEDKVCLKEAEMLAVLDRVVTDNGLSYTECCFERLAGMQNPVEGKGREPEKGKE